MVEGGDYAGDVRGKYLGPCNYPDLVVRVSKTARYEGK